MTWHMAVVQLTGLRSLLTEIRGSGGTISRFVPQPGGACIIWVTPER